MTSTQHRGILKKWKDDRGFGFIKPDKGTQEVFLHISALQGVSRRPKEGDVIFYQVTTESDGKIRASRAKIAGVKSISKSNKRQNRKSETTGLMSKIVFFAVLVVGGLIAMEFSGSNSPPPLTSVAKPGCNIKGNVSHNSGKKLYHLPGMEDYETTKISPDYGEKWFCTEEEAINSGWQKAPR